MQKHNTQLSSVFNIKQKMGYLKPKALAKKLNVSKRKDRKCSVVDIILGYWQLTCKGGFSFDNWAVQISTITGKTISGQAVWKRLTPDMVPFLRELLRRSFKHKCSSLIDNSLFCSFNNVYIQDATHFSLPRFLSQAFPGSYSKYGDSAIAKVQAIFNLKKGFFSDFDLCCFRDTDQKDAPRFISTLKQGDLIIRDLGYFVLDVFNQIKKKKAYFLSRFKYNVSVFDAQTGKELDLYKSLKSKERLDIQVDLGKDKKLRCRLIAHPLTEQLANQRRRKAKKDRNIKTKHSKEYIFLLGYSIYITNVTNQIWTPSDIIKAYKARWYIEILFKGWKSNLKIKVNIPEKYMTKQRAEFLLYASLLMVNLLVMPIFRKTYLENYRNKNPISIIKLCAFINQNIKMIINAKINILEQIKYYCCYESRKKRINAIETIYFNIS